MSRSRALLTAGLALVLLFVLAWALWPDASRESDQSTNVGAGPAAASGSTVPRASASPTQQPSPSPSAEPGKQDLRERRAKRDALCEQLLVAEAERTTRAKPRPGPPDEETPPAPGNLSDRIGGRDALLAELNRDFMPLADECIEQARARTPDLAGMLAVGLETIADEELGAIVESVTTPEANEIADAELHECIRETALSMMLPPPPEGGREEFMLTIPIGDED